MKEVSDIKENQEKCECFDCPSHPGNDEFLYCSRGISQEKINFEGCYCSGCDLWKEKSLNELYFCDKEKHEEYRLRKKREDENWGSFKDVHYIKEISETGEKKIEAMGSPKEINYSWDKIHFKPAQIKDFPLTKDEEIDTSFEIIGKENKIGFKSPLLVSGMSFGAVSLPVREIIAEASSELGYGFNTGEGGILSEELEISNGNLIAQYSTARFGVSEAKLKKADAIEVRFGQGAYPGKGSLLPGDKVTSKVAKTRGVNEGEDVYSPAKHPDISSERDLKQKFDELRKLTDAPIGAKIGCGNVEEDVEVLVDSGADFVSIDGFGGGTGATFGFIRDNVGIPVLAAIPRARKVINDKGEEGISLIAGGGLRKGPDFAKALALGADACYIGTGALIAINCDQYRLCYTNNCPTGITTQKDYLSSQLDKDKSVQRLKNYLKCSNSEICDFCRITGKKNVDDLSKSDLVSFDRELSDLVGIEWLDGKK